MRRANRRRQGERSGCSKATVSRLIAGRCLESDVLAKVAFELLESSYRAWKRRDPAGAWPCVKAVNVLSADWGERQLLDDANRAA
jgi:hypothetical protein